MNAAEIRTALTTQYNLSHDLHAEAERIREAHGDGFTDDPHYLLVSATIYAVSTTIETLRVLEAAHTPAKTPATV